MRTELKLFLTIWLVYAVDVTLAGGVTPNRYVDLAHSIVNEGLLSLIPILLDLDSGVAIAVSLLHAFGTIVFFFSMLFFEQITATTGNVLGTRTPKVELL